MKKRHFLPPIFSLMILPGITAAQSLRYSIALPYVALGAYSKDHTDVFSFGSNQASLAQIKKVSAGVYGERRFLLAATAFYRAALALPSRMGNFGLDLNYAGFKNFNENKIGLAYAKSLGSKTDLGIQFNYYSYRVPAYGSAAAFCGELGLIMHFTDQLHAGLHIYNPVSSKLSKTNNEKLAAAYKMGFGYEASESFFVGCEIIKEEEKPVNVLAGFRYRFMKQFFARAGFLSESSAAFAGIGVGFKNFRLDVSGSFHPQLGLSPGLLFVFEKKE